MTETYATSRAHEIMEELIGKERDRELKRRVEHLAGGGAGGGAHSLFTHHVLRCSTEGLTERETRGFIRSTIGGER